MDFLIKQNHIINEQIDSQETNIAENSYLSSKKNLDPFAICNKDRFKNLDKRIISHILTQDLLVEI